MSNEEPENADLWIDKGNALIELNKNEEALEAYEKALKFNPENIFALIGKLEALNALKKNKDSLEAITKALIIDPESKDLQRFKGHILFLNKSFEEALDIFENLLITDPENEELWYGKGASLESLERYEEALESFEKTIEICEKAPKSVGLDKKFYANALVGKGCTLSSLKRFKKALETLEKAKEIEPKISGIWVGMFDIFWSTYEYKKAIDIVDKAFYEFEDKEFWLELKARALFLNKKYGKSIEAIEDLISINPKNELFWIHKGNIFFRFEAFIYALRSYDQAIAIEPNNAYAWKCKGALLHNFGRYEDFQDAFTKCLTLNPKDSEAYNILSEHYLIFGDIKNANKCADNALLIDKENPFSLYLLGRIKIEEHDYATSIEYFKKAISLDLGNPLYLLWDCYAKYLMAELEFSSDEKKYQDLVLAIIRELEKVVNCNSSEYNNLNLIPFRFVNIIPYWFKNLTKNVFESIKQILTYLNVSEKFTVKVLESIYTQLNKFESTKANAYNYYFLACFYYKINDYYTAINYFKQCMELKPDYKIDRSSRDILNNIWNTKLRPSFLKWWLYSPSNLWLKRILFVILSSLLFGILLPSQASNLFLSSFFSSINWKENTIPLTFLTLIILLILASPNIQHFKSSQLEIDIYPPPAFELTPSLIEKPLNDLNYILRLREK